MNEFRIFLQAILAIPLPKPKKKIRLKRIKTANPLAIKPDEFLTHQGKPFRFSRKGAKRKIEKRKR